MAKHRPHTLIDGYNLIKCVPLYSESLNQSLAAARTHIEAELGSYAHKTSTEVTIFYDGDPDVGHPDYQQRDGVDIFFSRRPQKADDLIMEHVTQKHGARWLRVVTSDREIQRCAARHKIAFIDSPTFAEELENPRQRTARHGQQDPGSNPYWRPDRKEIEDFSAVFEQPTHPKQAARRAQSQPRDTDPNLTLDKAEVDEWEQLFKHKKSDQANVQRSHIMLMQDKFAFVSGVANHRSIAWGIARSLDAHGARLALSYLGDREKDSIDKLADELSQTPLIVPCQATDDDSVAAAFDKVRTEFGRLDSAVHSVAFARREDLEDGHFLGIEQDHYQLALSVSAYSLNALSRGAVPLMEEGGSIVAMTYLGSVRAIPRYNVMGVAKAALESGVRYLARELGDLNIRVNGLSAGPVKTLAARGIGQFNIMLQTHAERAALKRNVTVEEVGNSALFLCSNLSSGITGEIVYVDAGYRFMGM